MEYIDQKHVVTVNSCTSALFLSLFVIGVTEGDEVICPSLTWCSTANAALYLKAKPVFCDIDFQTLCIDVDELIRLPYIFSVPVPDTATIPLLVRPA
jgi:dTDP-4-amino-4,6-dideoxygalactose transaminase